MIVFVGKEPSKKNKDPRIPFVGTKSYKRLLEWIYRLDIDLNEVHVCNLEHLKNCSNSKSFYIDLPNIFVDLEFDKDKIIALGKDVSNRLNKLNLNHYSIDHPSGLNRKLNDKKYVEKMLKSCKIWLERSTK